MGKSFWISRVTVFSIWIYHGLVPKLLFCDPSEIALVNQGPVVYSAEFTTRLAGVAEILIGLAVVIWWRHKWPMWLSLLSFGGLLLGALCIDLSLAKQAFNPVTLSVAAMALSAINLVSGNEPQGPES